MKTRFSIHKFKNRCCCQTCRAVGSRGGACVSPVFGRSVNPISIKGRLCPSHFYLPPCNFRPSDSRYGSTDLTLIYLLINQNWKCRFRKNAKYFLTKIKHRWHSIHRNCHHTKSISKLLLLNSDVKILKF